MSKFDGPVSALRQVVRRRASPGAVVLGYHDVSAPGTHSEGMTVSADALAGHVTLLRQMGLRIVAFGDIVDRLDRGADVDGLAALTFDDALEGVHLHAMPVLRRFEAPATVFVVTDARGAEPAWWPGMARTLTDGELVEVAAAGHDLGSHTCTHRSLPALTPDELTDELERSRLAIAGLTTRPVEFLAYPSGHHNAEVRAAAQRAGYRAATTFLNGRVDDDTDPYRIPRLTMGAHLTPVRLRYHLLRAPHTWPDHQLDRVVPAVASPPQ